MTECDCPLYGFCDRHQIYKNKHWHQLCQTNKKYFIAWEDGTGPGQLRRETDPKRKKPKGGPGTEMKKIIPKWLFKLLNWTSEGCNCNGFAKQMDRWGVKGCESRFDLIVERLVENAGVANKLVPMASQEGAQWATREAIERARKKEEINNRITTRHKGGLISVNLHAYESIPAPTNDRAVVMIAPTDNFKKQAEITAPLAQEYASRCGADFVMLTDEKSHDWPMGNKYRLRNVLDYYAQTLYVDVDVIIRQHAPDIFSHVGPDTIGVYNEYPDLRAGSHTRWLRDFGDPLCQSQEVRAVRSHCIVNGGVMVIPYSLRHLYDPPPKPFKPRWTTDQHWLSIQLQIEKPKVKWLDGCWNHTFLPPTFWQNINQAYFIHVNGSRPLKYRLELLRRLVNGNFEPFHPPSKSGWRPAWARNPMRPPDAVKL